MQAPGSCTLKRMLEDQRHTPKSVATTPNQCPLIRPERIPRDKPHAALAGHAPRVTATTQPSGDVRASDAIAAGQLAGERRISARDAKQIGYSYIGNAEAQRAQSMSLCLPFATSASLRFKHLLPNDRNWSH